MVICPHCGKEFDEKAAPKPKRKWYHTNHSIVFLFLLIGPFALPMVWSNPHYKITTKWITTILMLSITMLAVILCIELVKMLIEQIQNLSKMM
ncbi:MAG: hypothetical protein A2Y12_18980 [Planctomycetes bacterium GWF2_42_9]|nr:MAG: hypothetical protein A2Y12_18980 [Planctomycetes bacterium GWF2_42_9]HAL46076.1 hypothetical protein [Phycisphaerales bacterium]